MMLTWHFFHLCFDVGCFLLEEYVSSDKVVCATEITVFQLLG